MSVRALLGKDAYQFIPTQVTVLLPILREDQVTHSEELHPCLESSE